MQSAAQVMKPAALHCSTVIRLRYIDYQKFGGFSKLLDHFPVFFLQAAFKITQVPGFRNTFPVEGNGFNQVVTKVHHECHRVAGIIQNNYNFLSGAIPTNTLFGGVFTIPETTFFCGSMLSMLKG